MNNRPIKTFTCGCIKISIWPRNSDLGPAFSISPRKVIKKEDRWCHAISFGDYDVASLVLGLLECHLWIQNQKAEHGESIKLPLLIGSEDATDNGSHAETDGVQALCCVEPANSSTPESQE